jgi:hypothetical protein
LKISIEDLEDIGFYRLGHQKRLLLGIKKVRELKKLGQVPRQFQLGGGGADGSFNNHHQQGPASSGPDPGGYVLSPGITFICNFFIFWAKIIVNAYNAPVNSKVGQKDCSSNHFAVERLVL